MSILVADAMGGVRMAPDDGAPFSTIPCPFESPYMPCASREHLYLCCRRACDCMCLRRSDLSEVCRMPALPALSAMCLSPCGRYQYQLSSEADCIHVRHAITGELLFCAQVGVFPRMMRLHPRASMLLAAGGAVGEAYLFRAPELTCERVIPTRGACFTADFWNGGLLLVCAQEGDDIQTVVYSQAPNALRPKKVIALPGQPGGLCVCPDGQSALLSTPDGLMKLDIATGRLLWNLPEWPLCMRLSCRGGMALISDTLSGQVCLLRHEQPWIKRILCSGSDAQASFC